MADPFCCNRFMEELDRKARPVAVYPSYYNSDGKFNWDKDKPNGFDPLKGTKRTTLKKGTRILRYGYEGGSYAAPLYTPYSQLALPYQIKTCQYNEYEVTEGNTIHVYIVRVTEGYVAAQSHWPSEPGGGIQYYFVDEQDNELGVLDYIDIGLRRLEVSEWSPVLEEDRLHP